MFKYLLVLCLSIALLLSQADRLHIHLETDHHSISSKSAFNLHIVSAHPESTLHDVDLAHDHNEHQDKHSVITVDVSSEQILKKTNLWDPLLLILFFIGFFVIIHRLMSVSSRMPYQIPFSYHYYLLQPPLRAPPVK